MALDGESAAAEAGDGARAATGSALKIFQARQQEDILAVRDITLEYHAESRYAHILFSERKFIRLFSKAISNPSDTLALYVQHNGRTVGLLNAGAGDYYSARAAGWSPSMRSMSPRPSAPRRWAAASPSSCCGY
ncbi:hypothetical protein [Devosia neptuniae]|uniref:hypothetical protein n=1 Tax=Devosia TaxID=46913 RepID=UPI0022B0145A|nr:hypothetical protein [Devosia neptuniae]MCZ4347324.1 hypothetical protein [Devosia neptuniae]